MNEEKALFIIFGGTGDLARRKLYPALFNLFLKGYLKKHFAVIGTARRPWTDEHYREVIHESLEDDGSAEGIDSDVIDEFAGHFYYQSHNVNDTEHYETLRKLAEKLDQKYSIGGNRIFYLAMSPRFFGTIAKHLKTQKVVTEDGYNRLVIEKPFGRDEKSAIELNSQLAKYFPESSIFRIDHYLGKEMVQNISALRFGNNILASLWNSRYIDNIQITLSESLGVEERAGYYETAGALRDMVQNHIMQIVSLLTMNAPVSFNGHDIRKEKASALKALKIYTPEEVKANFVRGQYGPGNGMKGYRQEDKIADDSTIETFVAGKVIVDNMNFAGVPIYVRTGKRLAEKTSRIDIVFKKMPANIFKDLNIKQNILTISIDPDESVTLHVNDKKLAPGYQIDQIPLVYRPAGKSPDGYEKLFHDVLVGDPTNFASWHCVKYSWHFVDAIRQAWDAEKPDFPNYVPGSMGPKAADELLAKDGKHWIFNPLADK